MKKVIKFLTIIMPVVFAVILIAGCSNVGNKTETAYFQKGVYKSYAIDKKDKSEYDFYIFYDENSGYTEDSEQGIGLPFSCIQKSGVVKFKFGGSEEPEEIFKVKAVQNGTITGSFDDNIPLIFNPVQNANPDNFDAVEYLKNEKAGQT